LEYIIIEEGKDIICDGIGSTDIDLEESKAINEKKYIKKKTDESKFDNHIVFYNYIC